MATPPRVYRDATAAEKVIHSLEKVTPAALLKGIAGAHVQEAWHRAVLDCCEKFGVPTIDMWSYVSYGDGLKYKVCKYVWLMDRALEHQILRERWEGRGLRSDVLDCIDSKIPWNYGKLPVVVVFKLDEGKLDVNQLG